MQRECYEEIYCNEKSYWWFLGRERMLFSIAGRYIPLRGKKILDVGCGTGRITGLLSKNNDVLGVDTSDIALKFCRRNNVRNVRREDATRLSFNSNSFDAVVTLDCLEHIEDDQKALREIARVLKKGGVVYMNVPACMFLWSMHDVALGHYRRYAKRELKRKVRAAGLRVERISYANSILFAPVLLMRLLSRLLPQKDPRTLLPRLPSAINWLFLQAMVLEARIIRYVSLPFGVSLVCIARKI